MLDLLESEYPLNETEISEGRVLISETDVMNGENSFKFESATKRARQIRFVVDDGTGTLDADNLPITKLENGNIVLPKYDNVGRAIEYTLEEEPLNGYVYLRVTVPCDTTMVDKADGTPMGETGAVPMYKFMIKDSANDTYVADESFSPKQRVNEHWQLIHEDGKDYTEFDEVNKDYVYVYAYADGGTPTILERNDITNPLFDKLLLWNFNENFDKDKPHDVKVEALGIQTDIPASDINGVWAYLSREVDGS